ncbi:mandelate racemase [Actinopolyspora erythraea]|uniref:Mandelate racemase n=1 Tax=Actinopolyspora erythraea TaxID=414996 RepID=A0A223RS53_9ACTN|nr:enolase C-terminal domain-like protein [Actinopolyspora erythraea]ASU78664.1 mandelate racemase [Actinopolyspora erythraea]
MSEAVLYRVRLPMRVSFDHPAARRATSDSLVLSLTSSGVRGIGECAPRSYVTGETCESVLEQLRRTRLDRLFDLLESTPAGELLSRLLREGFTAVFGISGGNNLICLLETAVLDLLGNATATGAWQWFGGVESSVETGSALPFSQVLDLSLSAEEFVATRGPFHFVKIKASGDTDRDVDRVETVRRGVGDRVPLMVDANMSWSPAEALDHARRLASLGVDYLEEPLAKRSWPQLRALRRDTGLGVMLDESVCSIEDAETAVGEDACDAFNVRVAKNGGPLSAARLIGFARRHGVRFQVGVQVAEVGPLINAGRALAFGNRDALTVEAGQSDRFFPEMIVSPRPAVDRENNTLAPVDAPGLGMRLNDAAQSWEVLRRAGDRPEWRPLTGPRHH